VTIVSFGATSDRDPPTSEPRHRATTVSRRPPRHRNSGASGGPPLADGAAVRREHTSVTTIRQPFRIDSRESIVFDPKRSSNTDVKSPRSHHSGIPAPPSIRPASVRRLARFLPDRRGTRPGAPCRGPLNSNRRLMAEADHPQHPRTTNETDRSVPRAECELSTRQKRFGDQRRSRAPPRRASPSARQQRG